MSRVPGGKKMPPDPGKIENRSQKKLDSATTMKSKLYGPATFKLQSQKTSPPKEKPLKGEKLGLNPRQIGQIKM